ncbi:MAG: Dabb family protein [Candidatus Saccharimonadaceae bacterium]
MIKHVVLFKLASFAEGNSKLENVLYLKAKLENLQSLIPELLKIEVFINMPLASTENFDLILITEFENFDDLYLYINHPDHQKVVSFISKVKTDRIAIDYEF